MIFIWGAHGCFKVEFEFIYVKQNGAHFPVLAIYVYEFISLGFPGEMIQRN